MRSGETIATIQALQRFDSYLSAEQALQAPLLDEICSFTLPAESLFTQIFSPDGALPSPYQASRCWTVPLHCYFHASTAVHDGDSQGVIKF